MFSPRFYVGSRPEESRSPFCLSLFEERAKLFKPILPPGIPKTWRGITGNHDELLHQLGVGRSQRDEETAPARETNPHDRTSAQGFDHGPGIFDVLLEGIWPSDGVRRATATRLDRNDAELLAELFDQRLEQRRTVCDWLQKDEANVAAPMLVEGDTPTISDNAVQPMEPVHDSLPHRRIRDGLESLLITLIGRLNIPQQAVQISEEDKPAYPLVGKGGDVGEQFDSTAT